VVAFLVALAAPARSAGRWTDRLFDPVDIASLIYFRILFGGILFADAFRYFRHGWIAFQFLEPRFHFTYYGFGWVHPWPGNGMYVHFAAMGILAFFVLIGFAYRLSAALLFLCFTYMFLLDQAIYLNHYYFVSLVSFLMIFVPAHRKFSVDAWLRPRIASEFAPAWSLWILRAQMGFVYFFGGVAKINSDWLQGWPLRMWLPQDLNLPVLSAFKDQVWLALFFSYSGLCIDLFCVPLLLWRRTRPFMFTVLATFHLTNLSLFDIGIFPWFATAMTVLYFDPDWPRRLLAWFIRAVGGVPPPAPVPQLPVQSHFRAATAAGLAVYCALQVLIPLRHWLYPGNVAWTEEGHRFSWRMKLRDKQGSLAFVITDPENGQTREANIPHYLPKWQYTEMAMRPDMLQEFAHYLADRETQPGHTRVQVRVQANISLNGRREQPMIDPNVDLAATERSLRPASWITQLTAPRRKSLLRGSQTADP
jgi:vitamin K-dependent gamma-carboxylase